MKRSITSLVLAVVLPLGAAGAVLSTSTDAHAQRAWGHSPSPAYIARNHPVYYNGYAHYYYNNHWTYYRPGAGWYAYDHNPAWFCSYRDEAYGWHGC